MKPTRCKLRGILFVRNCNFFIFFLIHLEFVTFLTAGFRGERLPEDGLKKVAKSSETVISRVSVGVHDVALAFFLAHPPLAAFMSSLLTN